MANETRVRCPYCKKVFLWKRPTILNPDTATINLSCPYCKERLVLKKDMIVK
ncbi:MAG: hypothetical protein H0S85_02645 [Desulfovibrionaceae bacterium]|nr:hypothetical protein [Desulfovibrionaceae bacterium]